MFLTALEYLRGETVEKADEASALASDKLEISGQHVQEVQCLKEEQVATLKGAGTGLAEQEAVTGLSNQPTQERETTGKWLIRFKFLGNV